MGLSHTTISLLTENGPEKKRTKYPLSLESRFLLRRSGGRVRIWCEQHVSKGRGGVQPGTSKRYLTEWPVSGDSFFQTFCHQLVSEQMGKLAPNLHMISPYLPLMVLKNGLIVMLKVTFDLLDI